MSNVLCGSVSEVRERIPRSARFALVGGCFDLIHVGHVHLLEYAASLEGLLVVAVLSDSYARKYKDSLRPIINQKQRAMMVASIRVVDFVYISDVSPSSIQTLQLLKPSSVVFDKELVDSKKMSQRNKNFEMASPDTRIRFLNRYNTEEVSTSHIINKIRMATLSE